MTKRKWKRGDRIVVHYENDDYYLATVTITRQNLIYIEYDDGDKESFSFRSKRIIGKAKNRSKKSAISKSDLSNFLIKTDPLEPKPKKVKSPKKEKATMNTNNKNGLDVPALENWLWDAACQIRGPLDAPKFLTIINLRLPCTC